MALVDRLVARSTQDRCPGARYRRSERRATYDSQEFQPKRDDRLVFR